MVVIKLTNSLKKSEKFDAIVEKAGKVDANYAAQIEGYCSLLGEYGKKFEAVCAMLQPEKLRLSPDKYREKLEGINTGYQNAKDTHEQEQSAYEAELYEIETVWYKKMLDKAEDYLIRSAECVVLGNFTDEVTVLGVGVQIVLGIFDLDLPGDIRDIIADIKNLAETDRVRWDLIGMLALDLIGLIPVIGALKYSDEVGTLFKNAGKVSVVAEGADGVGAVARHADEAGAWLHGGKVFRYSDETAEAVASGEKLLKESQTVYESFADMMSPDDAAKYLDFLENGSKEGLTSAELAGVEKADVLLVSQKVGYDDVWDLRNVGDLLETSYGKSTLNSLKNTENFTDSAIEHIFEGQVNARGKAVGYHYEGIEGTSSGGIEMKYRIEEYKLKNGIEDISIIFDEKYQLLTTFMSCDVLPFEKWIKSGFDRVLSGKSEYEEVNGNVCCAEISPKTTKVYDNLAEDAMGNWCEVDTKELRQLIDEWCDKVQKFKMSITTKPPHRQA